MSEEDLLVLLRKRIQDSKKLEKEIAGLREGVDEKSIKSKFENNSRILDDIMSSQIPSSDRYVLGFVKDKNPESSPLTNQRGSTKSYAEVLKSLVKKEKCKEHALSFHETKDLLWIKKNFMVIVIAVISLVTRWLTAESKEKI